MNLTGRIYNIQRFSIHDGPGVRTVVFFKGCNLKCLWCPNPESISSNYQIEFMPSKCINCGTCFEICPQKAHKIIDGKHIIDRDACNLCFKCTDNCYDEA